MTALVQDAGDSPSRWLHLQGACNVRDLGGLVTPEGITRAGVLLRSDDLLDLTPRDVDVLTTVAEVALVIDLRSEGEVRAMGPGPLVAAGVDHVNLPITPQISSSPLPVADRALAAYRGYLTGSMASVTAALQLIAEPRDGAVLVHCAAGKDRTGVIVALALTLAGVSREDVVRDHLASGDVVPAVIARLRSRPFYSELMGAGPLAAHLPRPDTLPALLQGLEPGWATEELARAMRTRLVTTRAASGS